MIAHTTTVEHLAVFVAGFAAIGLFGWAMIHTARASVARFLLWSGGILALLVATSPGTESWAQRSFTGHMVQHLVLIVVAAPMLVLAAPVRTLRPMLRVAHRSTRTERSVRRWWRANGPLLSAAGFISVLYLSHLTGIYDLALTNRAIHDIEHLAYIAGAVALWAAVRSSGRQAAIVRIGAVFAVIGASALLGVVLLSASTPLVETYADRLGPDEALADQRLAASLMWVGGMATTLPLLVLSVWSWATTEERIARRTESLATRPTTTSVDGEPVLDPRVSDH